jgi:hypothetical protein
MKVYLGGPINGCTDDEANGWRTEAKRAIESLGHTWLDPMARDYRGREQEPGINKLIVEGDKKDIAACQVLLMNAPKPSAGTSMEILEGWNTRKVVITVVPVGDKPSPWITYHSTRTCYGSVVKAITDYLTGK